MTLRDREHAPTDIETDLRYERWFLPLSVSLGLGPQRSDVRIENDTLHVSMGGGSLRTFP